MIARLIAEIALPSWLRPLIPYALVAVGAVGAWLWFAGHYYDQGYAARSAEVGKVLPEVYEKDGTYWVARLIERQEPDRAAFDEAKSDMARQALRGRRDSLFGGWVEAQRQASQVE